MSEAAFFRLHDGLPREGPGDSESLARALRLAETPRDARILDAGCGPGADIAALLAHAPDGHVTAVDAHAPFAARAAEAHAQDPRVTVRAGDMTAEAGPFELIWCAGAIYFPGIGGGLHAFRRMLAPGGAVAFSEPVWRTGTPSKASREVWQGHPAMTDAPGVRRQITDAGFDCLGDIEVAETGWEAYFAPLAARIADLRPDADADLAAILDAAEAEIALRRAHGAEYAYTVFVARPAP